MYVYILLYQRLTAYLHSKKTPPYVINLDPAVHEVPFPANIGASLFPCPYYPSKTVLVLVPEQVPRELVLGTDPRCFQYRAVR